MSISKQLSDASVLNSKLSTLEELIERLRSDGLENVAPVRFGYIQSLYQKLTKPHNRLNVELIEKIQATAEQYLADVNDYRCESNKTLKIIANDFPQQADAANDLFEQSEFKKVEQLLLRLIKRQAADKNIELLRQLTISVNPATDGDSEQQSASFDRELYQQEQNARQTEGEILSSNAYGSGEQLVMQSMKHFRESMKHVDIDKLIARAITEGPENPGPLNPQMLAIKSLTQMRKLSPMYLRRFAAYIETMLWLEKNAAKLTNTEWLSR
ncbi:MAG: hypothetical protein ACI854_001919 [Arenicella sp.]|jgi:hypothetical protein